MIATQLKTNYLRNPIGIDPDSITFSWIPQQGIRQTAFQIIIRDKNGILSDSGKVLSQQCIYTPNVRFTHRQRVNWSITLWDEKEIVGGAQTAFFETGIAKNQWIARWINPEPDGRPIMEDPEASEPASYLRKRFTVENASDARLYITAHGVYDAWINGKHVDGYFLAPGTSEYQKRLQVQTYDISGLLTPGENEITVMLGNGWWRGRWGWNLNRYNFGTDISLLCQIMQGNNVIAATDSTWEASRNGPLGSNDLMRGEHYDARKKISHWQSVKEEPWGFDTLIGTDVPVKAHERFSATMFRDVRGNLVLDFGQNFAGYVELDVQAQGGEKVILTHGEVLDAEGCFQTLNFQNRQVPLCDQRIEYICKSGRNVYHQTTCYFGFRYVKVETELPVTGKEFTGVAVYSDMEQTAFFSCGNKHVNQLFSNTLWSMKSNFVDIPTDCPHREKAGFSGDCQAFSGTAMYLMDCYPVLARWLREQAASQIESGNIKQLVPKGSKVGGKDGSAGWCDSFEIIPYRMMKLFPTTALVRELYPKIKSWMQFCIDRGKSYRPENAGIPQIYRDYIVDTGNHWGEWCEPGRSSADYKKEWEETGHAELATAFMAYGCKLVSEIADRLSFAEDAAYFRTAYEKTKAAYRYVFLPDGKVQSNRQCHYVRPIAHNLLTEEEKWQTAADLAELIKAGGGVIGTGFLTTYELCNVLTDYGQSSIAYDLLLNTQQPSWLFEVQQGATTIWESWFGIRPNGERQGSHNHYSFGSISGWLMSRAVGIVVEDGTITIRPYPDARLGYVQGIYLSPYGKIVSGWKYENGRIRFNVEVPCNCTANLVLPNGEVHKICTGNHTFCVANTMQRDSTA